MDLDILKQDVRYTFRTFRRDLGFFAAAVLVIGLGIGANTTIFSVVNALLFRPLQFQSADRLVWMENTEGDAGLSSRTTRVASFLDWRRMSQTLEDQTAYFA